MVQFLKCKPTSNIRQDFPNHFMSLWSDTWKRRQSKFSASASLIDTIQELALQTVAVVTVAVELMEPSSQNAFHLIKILKGHILITWTANQSKVII